MWYVVARAGRGELSVYPIPTRERAERLAHCMGGFWRYKGVEVIGGDAGIPLNEHGQPPAEVWQKATAFKPGADIVTVYNQGYNAGTAEGKLSEAEGFYCGPKAVNWRPGLPRCA
jgi:hypothetical protein